MSGKKRGWLVIEGWPNYGSSMISYCVSYLCLCVCCACSIMCAMQTLIISFSYWLVVDGSENNFGVRMIYFQFVVDSWEWLKKRARVGL